ncbi:MULTISPECIES: hypothetical protein [unclassified Nonomuraea]|uniref:hypothetical protein n=1 Tax=unclassified Nonomuraea TaxID=2593643 RepID=UPI0035C19D76
MTAFAVAGVSLATGLGTASAAASAGPQVPGAVSTCLLPLPILCEEQPDDSWSGGHEPGESRPGAPGHDDSWSDKPVPEDSWSSGPAPQDSWSGPPGSEPPWRPAGEEEHKVPRGHPETGGGGLTADGPVWPFAVGGAALLTGAGLTGFAVRRRKGVV